MTEQAEDLEDLYEKRLEQYRKSVKKDNRKRRRREDGKRSNTFLMSIMYVCLFSDDCDDDAARDASLRTRLAALNDHVEELETELSMERKRGVFGCVAGRGQGRVGA